MTPGGHLVHLQSEATNSFSAAASTNEAAREAVRTALVALLDAETATRSSAITTVTDGYTAGDASTLASANTYTDTQISTLLGNAPDLLNTLSEIADAIGDDADFITSINNAIAAVQADVDTNEADGDAAIATETAARTSADSSLSARIDVLEADPTTAAAVAAVQADVDQNESDSDAADSALSARLDVLEADPTTATALAAVQADVNQNEADADAAIAAQNTAMLAAVAVVQADVDQNESDSDSADSALSARLDTLEADPTTAAAVTAGDAATLSSANSYTDTSISNLVNGADTALDTLKEIGDALAAGDTSVTNALTTQITTEASTRASADSALSSRLDTLEGQTLDSRITALQADVDQNESDADSGIAANTALITAEETARIAADLAETSARTAAITSEAATRAAADAAETTARSNAITAEETARIAADNTLTTDVAALNTSLTATNTAYAAADANLQTQITSAVAVEAATEVRNLRAGLCFGQLYVTDLQVA